MTQTSDLSDLIQVGIETHLGAQYLLPDMPRPVIETLLRGGITNFEQLSLVNNSKACLVIPTRIIRIIYVDGIIAWTSPA